MKNSLKKMEKKKHEKIDLHYNKDRGYQNGFPWLLKPFTIITVSENGRRRRIIGNTLVVSVGLKKSHSIHVK